MVALEQEWRLCAPLFEGKELVSIYFGGGTPSLLGPNRLEQILSWVKKVCSVNAIEITLEANPEDVSKSLMKEYADAGVNRVSMGVQSLDNRLLKLLSRTHGAEKAIKAVYTVQEAGFENISIDLMYDIPQQTLEHWETTLIEALKLPINHLSLYNLVIEEHTVFFKKKNLISPMLPDPEMSKEMYLMAQNKFRDAGWNQYEISAFEKPGYYSRHNIGYWTGRPFYGLGPSAFSYWEGKRFRNVANINKYAQELQEGRLPIDFKEELDEVSKIRELLAIRLRLMEGVDLSKFEELNGKLDVDTVEGIRRMLEEGLLDVSGGHIRLSEKGILFYDTVATEIV